MTPNHYSTTIQLQVSINRLYPGEKLKAGDPRWREYNGGFRTEAHTPDSLLAEIMAGHSFCCALSGYRASERFISAQTAELDFDTGNLSRDELANDSFIATHGAFIYSTLSHTEEDKRWRVVFVLAEPVTDPVVYRQIRVALIARYPKSDRSIKDVARFLYGTLPGKGITQVLGGVLGAEAITELLAEFDANRQQMRKDADAREMPPVDRSKLTGTTPDVRYVEAAINQEFAFVATRPADQGVRYCATIPMALKLESLRLSPWLSPEARRLINTEKLVWDACAANGGIASYGEKAIIDCIAWGVAHAEPRTAPQDWGQQNGHASYIPEEQGETVYSPTEGMAEQGAEIQWGEVESLDAEFEPPELPAEMIPDVFRPWVMDVANQGCLPLEMVAGPAIVAASIIIGRKLGVRPWNFNNFIVIPNVWGAIIARPGSMKSSAIGEAIKPLKRLGVAAHEKHANEKAIFQTEVKALKAQEEALEAEMKASAKGKKGGRSIDGIKPELIIKAKEREGMEKLAKTQRRYWVADSTHEKLADLVSENPNGLLVSYDELSGWISEMDREGHQGSRAFYLTSWDGKESHQIDRIGRGETFLPAVCLSVIGSIQPDKLKRQIDEAMSGNGGGDGMIQRFQILIYVDSLPEWKEPERWPDTPAKNHAYEFFKWVDDTDFTQVTTDTSEGVPYLLFEPEAQVLAQEWLAEIEVLVRGREYSEMPAFEAHIGKYRSLLPSLALIFHLLDVFQNPPKPGAKLPAISLAAFKLAEDWCGYLKAHAQRVYREELAPGGESATKLVEKIQSAHIFDRMPMRDIYRRHWGGLDTADKVEAGLRILESKGWVKLTEQQTAGAPQKVVLINPACMEDGNGKI